MQKYSLIMALFNKVTKQIRRFVRQQIVKEQYPMLTSFSRYALQKEGAIGLVYMLHHIDEKNPIGIPTNEDLKVSPGFLENMIIRYRKQGFDFVSLDKLYDIISSSKTPERPFVAFTIDDGYLDNYTNALPVFEKYEVPFAIFVATDFVDKKAVLWWDCLENLILSNESIATSDGKVYPCKTFQQRWDTFRYLRERILCLNQNDLVNELRSMFNSYQIDWYAPIKSKGLSWQQVRELANHSLCTIGGHTISHPALNKLSLESARHEIKMGLKRLEDEINQEVRFFAYPYGTPNEIGVRERLIVGEFKIQMAFMAHMGCITDTCINSMSYLPRIYLHEL